MVVVAQASWDADKLRANIRVLMVGLGVVVAPSQVVLCSLPDAVHPLQVALGNAKPDEARGSYLRVRCVLCRPAGSQQASGHAPALGCGGARGGGGGVARCGLTLPR